jgi:hypothetical protein
LPKTVEVVSVAAFWDASGVPKRRSTAEMEVMMDNCLIERVVSCLSETGHAEKCCLDNAIWCAKP